MAGSFPVISFYLGTFLTSFGSLLFTMGISSFFLKAGLSSAVVAAAVGVHRFSGITANALVGPTIDRFDSRKMILWTELLAAFTTAGLIFAWIIRSNLGMAPFILLCGVRAAIMGVQSTSRSRLVKLISGSGGKDEAGFVIWLNKVTQGAHVFSSLFALVLITWGRFEIAIAIDGLTFLVGSFTTWRLPDLERGAPRAIQQLNLFSAVWELIRIHRKVIICDALLSVSVSGTILLMVRLSNGDSQKVIIFNLLFGVCIWVSSIFAHKVKLRGFQALYWCVLAVGFFALSFNLSAPWNYISYFFAYLGYWILYHKYSVEIQTNSPQERVGGIMAARGFVGATILSLGELFGGVIQANLSQQAELIIRGCLCTIVVVVLVPLQFRDKRQ